MSLLHYWFDNKIVEFWICILSNECLCEEINLSYWRQHICVVFIVLIQCDADNIYPSISITTRKKKDSFCLTWYVHKLIAIKIGSVRLHWIEYLLSEMSAIVISKTLLFQGHLDLIIMMILKSNKAKEDDDNNNDGKKLRQININR